MDTQAYRVAVMLTINDQLSRQMAIISKDANQLYLRFNKINDTIKKITESADKAASSIAKMNKAMSGNAMAANGRGANEFAGAMKKAAESAQIISKMSVTGGFALPALVASGGALALTSSASRTPQLLQSGGAGMLPPGGAPPLLTGPMGYSNIPRGNNPLSGWRNGVPPGGWGGGRPPSGGANGNGGGNSGSHADGVANMAIAYGGFEFMKHAVNAGAEYQTMVEKFKQFGMGDAAVAEAEKFAAGVKMFGASKLDMLRYFTEAQGVFRESGAHSLDEQLKGAKIAAPVMAKMQVAMQGLDEHAKAMSSAKQMDMLRFVEQAGGLQDAKRFNALMNAGFKAIESSGGNVDFTQYRQFMAKAKTSAYGMSDTALFAEMEPIIGEMKGSSAGDAYMTAFNRGHGITTPTHQAAKEWLKLGLWDPKKVGFNSQGRLNITGDPLKDSATFDRSQFEFYKNDVLPAYQRLHYTKEQIRRSNAILFGRTGGGMYNLFDKQMDTILKGIPGYEQSRDLDSAAEAVKGTYAGKQIDFDAKWKEFQLALAQDGGLLDTFTRGLQGLTTFLKNMTEFSNNNPKLTSASMTLLEVVAAVSAFKGGVWLLKHALSAVFSPLDFLVGSKGVPLLTSSMEGFAGVLGRVIPLLGLIPTNNTPNTTQELKSLDNNKRQNWMQNNPMKPYAGSWQTQVAEWVKEHPGERIPNFRTDSNGFMYPEVRNPLQTINVNSAIYLDGRKVGDAVSQHIVKQGSKPPTGVSGVDATMTLLHPGMGSFTTR